MRIVFKLFLKLIMMLLMVAVMGGGLRYGRSFLTKGAGGEDPQFSSGESDMMATVFKSALRLYSGQASRNELAGELSEKLYASRGSAADMSDLGIELVKPGDEPAAPGLADPHAAPAQVGKPARPAGPSGAANPAGALAGMLAPPGAKPLTAQPGRPGAKPAEPAPADGRMAMLSTIWDRTKTFNVELALIPVVFFGMVVVQRVRRRKPEDDFVPPMAVLPPAETEAYKMKHAVHGLHAEEFELLIALVYQRQGYRISMPAALSGGRGGDFTLVRKSERILVQCKKLSHDHKIAVERVRELADTVTAAGLTRGMFVASCGFSWDARNFAKTRGITLISARTLDEVLKNARERPEEDLLTVSEWVPKLMTKVQFTPPVCPTCEAAMDQIGGSENSVWLCSQRPDCRSRRSARKYQKPAAASARPAEAQAAPVE